MGRFTTPEIGSFKSPEAERAALAAYDRMRDRLLPADRRERTVETAAGTTFAVTLPGSADRTPVLFIPSHGGTSMTWHDVVDALLADGDRPTIHLIDLVGDVGRSTQRAPLHRADAVADWLDEVLTGLGAERAHLVGISRGAYTALAYAVHEPGRRDDPRGPTRIASLTLGEPPGLDPFPLGRFIRRSLGVMLAFHLPAPLGRPLAAWLRSGIRRAHREHLKVGFKMMRSYRQALPVPDVFTDDELGRVTQPAYVLLGSHSEILDAARAAARVRAHMPSAPVEIAPDASHGVGFDRPELMLRAIRAFIDGRPRAERPGTGTAAR